MDPVEGKDLSYKARLWTVLGFVAVLAIGAAVRLAPWEHSFGQRPPYGILHYSNGDHSGRTYAIDFTPSLERAVLDTIAEIQTISLRKGVDRSHDLPARCSRCGFRLVCDQHL